ncbi:MAG: sigma-70 family RNA polymerase sigma factor [Planctomycetota bacterium]
MSISDGELMLLVRQNDAAAFDELVHRWEASLIKFFYRHAGDRALAEDCAQDVLLKLYRNRLSYVPSGSFRSFLFTIANNHWIDVVRSQRTVPAMLSADLLHLSAPAGELGCMRVPTPARQAEIMELGERIARAIRSLPDDQRAVWVLAEECSLRYSEVAAILRIPVGTVKSRMHFATLKLRELLKGELKP